ncbi:MAG: F0F1 ATP synthase subunit B [Turicibacter sp.]|uniref:ATP synthase subunit b n=1 Tax=Turicibacter faecis TaxID=2963365 RepID=A0ABN6ZDQ0_9FIRM|nr:MULTISPECIES: F0F1 ATP synthase subunit B [unclassified Turicibacter]MCI8701901.1 F0F1 ATP synthase subunit B [Turicibacter sp.]BEH91746.1 ATP synthase subunit b [Turicibacter sp. TC023]MCU7204939.1 F0F1 ATP synthase subunit B [Turicibacter sp. TA25]MCU7209744.1 F0F1 ATP synthase subunit B [Turicibacter sp. 1E2]NCE78982.1 ATP synthase F0 subunit B [Turicibacter sp. TS3]
MQIYIMPDLVNFTLQIVSTLLLFLVIKYFAWAPMKEFLRKRQELVSQEINRAEMLKSDAIALKKSAEAQVQVAREEAREIVENSKKQAQHMHDEIVSNARKEAQQKLSKAAADIEQERKAVYSKIRSDIVELAVSSAEKMIEKEIDADVHNELFDQFVAKVGGSHE